MRPIKYATDVTGDSAKTGIGRSSILMPTEVNVTRAVLGFTIAMPRAAEFSNKRSRSVRMRANVLKVPDTFSES